ncbi:hypothetical protein VWBp18 [Streptomyces phage VWB]|uniref:Uncharacterized protein n=1 Tax=Streptomyces phage VWB TaxID=10702 RepID=Q6VY71_9CAUD|nr:hypothetical protein VWBp18 [Streptomyces phage VWB]AAR29708.1 hypothetical protein [Streptomyces phage VWB]
MRLPLADVLAELARVVELPRRVPDGNKPLRVGEGVREGGGEGLLGGHLGGVLVVEGVQVLGAGALRRPRGGGTGGVEQCAQVVPVVEDVLQVLGGGAGVAGVVHGGRSPVARRVITPRWGVPGCWQAEGRPVAVQAAVGGW